MLTCVKHIYGFDNQLPCQSCWPSEVFDPKSASAWLVSGVNVTQRSVGHRALFPSASNSVNEILWRATAFCFKCRHRLRIAHGPCVKVWFSIAFVLCGGESQECSIVRNALREFESAPTSDVFVCILLVSVATQICFRNNIFSCSWTCQCRSIFFK